jgi:hypothetical protein
LETYKPFNKDLQFIFSYTPTGCGQPRPRPPLSPPAPAGAPRREASWQAAPGTILAICKLWDQGPPGPEEMSSSSRETEMNTNLEKLEEVSEERNRKETGSKKTEESSKISKKKEDEDLKRKKKVQSLYTLLICLILDLLTLVGTL